MDRLAEGEEADRSQPDTTYLQEQKKQIAANQIPPSHRGVLLCNS